MSVGCNGICPKTSSYVSIEIKDTATPVAGSISLIFPSISGVIQMCVTSLFEWSYSMTDHNLYQGLFRHSVRYAPPSDALSSFFLYPTWMFFLYSCFFPLSLFFLLLHNRPMWPTVTEILVFVPAVIICMIVFSTSQLLRFSCDCLHWYGDFHCLVKDESCFHQ